MGRKKKDDALAGRNGFDPADVERRVSAYESVQDIIDAAMLRARESCQPHRDDLKQIKKDAADEGHIPKKVFAAKLRERRLKRQADAIRQKLDMTDQETFDQLSSALGELRDLPLGEAALGAFKQPQTDLEEFTQQ
jgi:hypothetical protein